MTDPARAITREAAGLLIGVEDGSASGWAAPDAGNLPFVVIRLDGIPVGAGACLADAQSGDSAAEPPRCRFLIELDHGRLAHGGRVTAERIGAAGAQPLPGAVVVEAEALLVPASPPKSAFQKAPGLTIAGWIAAEDRGYAPPLRLTVNGKAIEQTFRPVSLAADAWRSGGSLASGYQIAIPIAVGVSLPATIQLSEAPSGELVWEGTVDESDCLIADLRALIACGTDRHGRSGLDVLGKCLAEFRDRAATMPPGDNHSTALALDLVGWLVGTGSPAKALDLLLLLEPQSAMKGHSTHFLDTVATLLCSLPAGDLPRLASWLDVPPDAPLRSRLLDFLAALTDIRQHGLADGGSRLFNALSSMGYGQAAVNWAWEALAFSGSTHESLRAFRRTLEMQIAAQNVPYSAGFEFIAEDAR